MAIAVCDILLKTHFTGLLSLSGREINETRVIDWHNVIYQSGSVVEFHNKYMKINE